MRVIFLDIDGVLTSARAHVALSAQPHRSTVWHHFDPVAIGFLNQLHDTYEDLHFVLSSTWRIIFDQHTMTMMLSQAGWRGRWHPSWKTDKAQGGECRGDQIARWLANHNTPIYAILDDDAAMLPDQMHRLVQTSPQDGMNSLDHFTRLKEILRK
jgi:hypothetical protein